MRRIATLSTLGLALAVAAGAALTAEDPPPRAQPPSQPTEADYQMIEHAKTRRARRNAKRLIHGRP